MASVSVDRKIETETRERLGREKSDEVERVFIMSSEKFE